MMNLDFLLSMAEPSSDPELDEWCMKYADRFSRSFPREMIPPAVTRDEMIRAIRQAIAAGNPDVLGLLGLPSDTDELI